MAISLYDETVYIVNREDIDYHWCVTFFESGHTSDYLLIYENDQYKGMISYKGIVKNKDLEHAMITGILIAGENMWNDAGKLFESDTEIDVLPVFSCDMEILYIARYDKRLVNAWKMLCEMRDFMDEKLWRSFKHFRKEIHICGVNDVLFSLREWLLSMGTEVSTEGEAWKYFGIEESGGKGHETFVVDQECRWLYSVYDEYRRWVEKQSIRLKELLCKSYVNAGDKKERVIFSLTQFPYFTDSMKPLIFRYIESGAECILTFPKLEVITGYGPVHINKMTELIEGLETAGAKCFQAGEKTLYDHRYFVCFVCSEYSEQLSSALKRVSEYIVAVQVTSLYTHMYQIKGRFEEVFSEQSRKEIDYLVTSEYIADWICKRDECWDEKILRFGYPKLDTLYRAFKDKSNTTKGWEDRIQGKKVVLMTLDWPEEQLLEYFATQEKEIIVIWRPHPHLMTTVTGKKRIKKISDCYNMIVDTRNSYDASFQVSDVLIAGVHSSVMVNYLYTGKPICIYGREITYQNAVVDYREELWYRCAYGTSKTDEVIDFIERLIQGDLLLTEEQLLCRKRMMNNFDGRVCDRIYEYFNKRKGNWDEVYSKERRCLI